MPGQPWDRGRPRPRPKPGVNGPTDRSNAIRSDVNRPPARGEESARSFQSTSGVGAAGASRATGVRTQRRRNINIGSVATILTLGLIFAPTQFLRDVAAGGRSSAEAPAPAPAPRPPSPPVPGPSTPPADGAPDASGASLNSPPADVSGLADIARRRTVTIECLVPRTPDAESSDDIGLTQGSGWPLNPEDLGALRHAGVTLIVTNGHVIGDCIDDPVVFVEGRGAFEARVLGIDWDREDESSLDLALLSIAADLPTFPIARDAAVGQWVMAAGSPMGLLGTVTFGAIANRLGSTIFTDAAIGPGNSGGPLFDARGRVIGTNKAVYSDFQGLSIADSIDGLCHRLISCS